MAIIKGNNKVNRRFKGTTEIAKVYKGSTLVFPDTPVANFINTIPIDSTGKWFLLDVDGTNVTQRNTYIKDGSTPSRIEWCYINDIVVTINVDNQTLDFHRVINNVTIRYDYSIEIEEVEGDYYHSASIAFSKFGDLVLTTKTTTAPSPTVFVTVFSLNTSTNMYEEVFKSNPGSLSLLSFITDSRWSPNGKDIIISGTGGAAKISTDNDYQATFVAAASGAGNAIWSTDWVSDNQIITIEDEGVYVYNIDTLESYKVRNGLFYGFVRVSPDMKKAALNIKTVDNTNELFMLIKDPDGVWDPLSNSTLGGLSSYSRFAWAEDSTWFVYNTGPNIVLKPEVDSWEIMSAHPISMSNLLDVAIRPSEPPERYTLSFDTDGGTPESYLSQLLEVGELATQPSPNPTKEGYSFTGWRYPDGTSWNFTIETMPAMDVTLTAGWRINTYEVIFYYTQVGSDSVSRTIRYGESLGESNMPPSEFPGYTFVGWKNPVNNTEFTADTIVTGNTIVIGEWKTNTVAFNYNGGNGGENEEGTRQVAPGDPIGPLPTATKANSFFSGWYTSLEGGEIITESRPITETYTTFYAHWNDIDTEIVSQSKTFILGLGSQTISITPVQAPTWNSYTCSFVVRRSGIDVSVGSYTVSPDPSGTHTGAKTFTFNFPSVVSLLGTVTVQMVFTEAS